MSSNNFYRSESSCQQGGSVSRVNPANRDYYRPDSIEPQQNICSRNAYQRALVSVPVAVKPFSFSGPTKTYCCNDPVIKEIWCKPCGHEQICYFTISQEICVEIPIHFGAKACVGKPWVDCQEATTDDCSDCNDSDCNDNENDCI